MGEQRPENTVNPQAEDAPSESVSSRRSFLSKNLRRAVYIAPIVWSVSARTALAVTGATPGPSVPE